MNTNETRPGRSVKDNPNGLFVRRIASTCAKLGFSRVTLWRKRQQDPSFPAPVETSPGVIGFLDHELDAWLERRIAARDRGEKPAIVAAGERLARSGKGSRPPGKARAKRQLDLVE
jgi:prophage regulatory protein